MHWGRNFMIEKLTRRVMRVACLCTVVGLAAPDAAHAQPAIAKTEQVKKARDCLNAMKADGERAGFFTDREATYTTVMHPTDAETLLSIQTRMVKCLDDAFDGKRIIVKNPNGVQSRVWYVKADDLYAFCATGALGDELKDVDRLGGYSDRRQWFAILFTCNVDQAILKFHRP